MSSEKKVRFDFTPTVHVYELSHMERSEKRKTARHVSIMLKRYALIKQRFMTKDKYMTLMKRKLERRRKVLKLQKKL